jgi:hypothetical protein
LGEFRWEAAVMDPQGSAAADGKETAGGGSSSTTDENRSGKETSVENMMKNLKLTAAEADRLVDDDEEETEKPMWALAGKILSEPKKIPHQYYLRRLATSLGKP